MIRGKGKQSDSTADFPPQRRGLIQSQIGQWGINLADGSSSIDGGNPTVLIQGQVDVI